MTVGYHDGRRRSKQSLFFYQEHAAHVRAYPIASVSVVYDVVSPRRRVAVRMVDDNHVAQLSGLWVVDIQPVIGADNHPSVKVCIHTAHAVVRHVVGRRALTEPHELGCVVGHEATSGAVSNESVGASEPKSAVCAAMYQMKAVALARIGDVAQLSVVKELALSQARHAQIGASPKVSPSVAEHSPHNVVGYGARRARVVQSVCHLARHLIIYVQSVVGAGVYIVGMSGERLHRIAVQLVNSLHLPAVVSVQSALRAYPRRAAVAEKCVYERLMPFADAYGASLCAAQDRKSRYCAHEKSVLRSEQRVDIAQTRILGAHLSALRIDTEQTLRAAVPYTSAVHRHGAHLFVRRAAECLESTTPYVVDHRSALGCHVESVAQHEHRVDASVEVVRY